MNCLVLAANMVDRDMTVRLCILSTI